MALGELGLMPNEFWTLTNGELSAKIRGYVVNKDLRSADHRNLFTLMGNINRDKNTAAKNPRDVWPLDIEHEESISNEEKQKLFSKIANNG